MKRDNPFDKKLEVWKSRIPEEVLEAATFVNDTLELSLASAQSVFEKDATHEHALAIYDRIAARIQSKIPTV